MALYVPDGVRIYEADIDNWMLLTQHSNFMGLGPQVLAQTVPNMTVKTTGGPYRLRRTGNGIGTDSGIIAVNATDPIAVAASDPANPRIDLVHVSLATGVTAVVTGTPTSTPKPPALPANSVLLGYVSVSAAAVNIQQSNITQRAIAQNDNVIADTLANRPSAVAHSGTLYVVTDGSDGQTIYRSNGATGLWVQIAAGANPSTAMMPNFVLNSDFGRRTVLGLAMPEVFVDTNGFALDAGTAGSVASNQWTMGTVARTRAKWGGSAFLRDGRISAQFKATDAASGGVFDIICGRGDGTATTSVRVYCSNSLFVLDKIIGGSVTGIGSVAQAITTNNWYWLELEMQGTTFVAKLYSSGATPVAKASATLLQTLSGTASDGALAFGFHAIVDSVHTTNAGIWGGQSASPGGVYVETWLPESWAITFGGTLGGQAVGIDETTDVGPAPGKQWSLRHYVPNAARTITVAQPATKLGSMEEGVSYTMSTYYKVSGKGGSGSLMTFYAVSQNTAGADIDVSQTLDEAGVTGVGARLTKTFTSVANTRQVRFSYVINAGSSATGTVWAGGPQFERGSAVTAWRNAPADDAPITWHLVNPGLATTTSTSMVELDPRDMAINLFTPWDASLLIDVSVPQDMSTGTPPISLGTDLVVDGATLEPTLMSIDVHAALFASKSAGYMARTLVSAGKHRVTLRWKVAAGTGRIYGRSNDAQGRLQITAYRGK